MATLEEITARLKKAVAEQPLQGKTVTVDLKGEGYVHISGSEVTNDNAPADCTVIVSKDDLEAMTRGDLDPTTAFMTGKLKINGDMSVAMALQPILARARGG
ncbi:MAG TPA: SCP2 sterol-binding domain-containing protein [Caulobacteraceae bacterium]|jgi:putative sterol carrier protein|nr:SCP2 sterol-binding domain-containing protein [Caulobacteraceae bacterium]